ncbi:hypothetical protein [Merismopedia glauca]|nr:hypothetical protein [Merismopedia glauca]
MILGCSTNYTRSRKAIAPQLTHSILGAIAHKLLPLKEQFITH